MKYLAFISLLFAGLHLSATPIDSTINIDQQDINGSIASYIRSGDSKSLANYFSATLDLTVPGNEGTYSKSQAEIIVKNFFSQYAPVTFTVNQQGSSGEGSQFAIGTLKTASGSFRAYYLLKKSAGQQLIVVLQFEEE
ncbi:MAG: DUF4783 domain-containing protein [Bacteroidota bacterium]